MKTFGMIFRILGFCWILGCADKDSKQIVKERGFWVLVDPEEWLFFPAISLNQASCDADFISKNLGDGFRVPLEGIPDSTISKLRRSMDTLELVHKIPAVGGMYNYVLVSAGEIKYEIARKFYQTKSQLRSNLLISTRRKSVNLIYDQFPIHVLSVSTIFCLEKRSLDVLPVECKQDPGDPDNFLYKICEYLRSRNRYSELASKYRIKKVTRDTLDNKTVIKVSLSCCYFGDVAYFDLRTKELISINYSHR